MEITYDEGHYKPNERIACICTENPIPNPYLIQSYQSE